MMLFATAYRLGIEPFFFSHSKTKGAEKNYAQVLELFVVFGAVILLTVVVFIDFLKVLLIPNEAYWEAMAVVPILLLAYLFLGIYHNLSVWYKVTDRTKFGAYISVFGALITLVINGVFIAQFNYMASAVATLAAYFTMTLLSYYFGKKYYPIPYNLKKNSTVHQSFYSFFSAFFLSIQSTLYFWSWAHRRTSHDYLGQ